MTTFQHLTGKNKIYSDKCHDVLYEKEFAYSQVLDS